jgi:hypothetical protein
MIKPLGNNSLMSWDYKLEKRKGVRIEMQTTCGAIHPLLKDQDSELSFCK